MNTKIVKSSFAAWVAIFAVGANADTFTVTSDTTYTTGGTSLTYENKTFAPGKEVTHSAEEGSKGFFESQGATKAISVITGADGNSKYADAKVNIGASDDATNIDNMKKSLEIIKIANQKRVSEGRSILKVTDYLMAVSQIQTNWSRFKVAHSSMYNVGENLAWHPSIDSAFKAWYDEEKECYNHVLRRNMRFCA